MLPSRLHQLGQSPKDGHPLMRFQPPVTVREEIAGGLQLSLQRRRVVSLNPGDEGLVVGLYDLQHNILRHAQDRSIADARVFSSSTSTRVFSE